MDKEKLSSFSKEKLISEYIDLECKYNELRTIIENNTVFAILGDSEKWSVIPMNKLSYAYAEKKSVLAKHESCKTNEIDTVDNHDNYFILKDSEWYEVKTFDELLKSGDYTDLNKTLEIIRQIQPSKDFHTKLDYLLAFVGPTKAARKKIVHKIITVLKKSGHTMLKEKIEDLYKHEEYNKALLVLIEEYLNFYNIESLGNYNLYKVYVDKEFIEDSDAYRKAERNYFRNEYPASFSQDNGYDNTED